MSHWQTKEGAIFGCLFDDNLCPSLRHAYIYQLFILVISRISTLLKENQTRVLMYSLTF